MYDSTPNLAALARHQSHAVKQTEKEDKMLLKLKYFRYREQLVCSFGG